jgi:hypothetical protein
MRVLICPSVVNLISYLEVLCCPSSTPQRPLLNLPLHPPPPFCAGFTETGRVPNAGLLKFEDGDRYVDAYQFHYDLTTLL